MRKRHRSFRRRVRAASALPAPGRPAAVSCRLVTREVRQLAGNGSRTRELHHAALTALDQCCGVMRSRSARIVAEPLTPLLGMPIRLPWVSSSPSTWILPRFFIMMLAITAPAAASTPNTEKNVFVFVMIHPPGSCVDDYEGNKADGVRAAPTGFRLDRCRDMARKKTACYYCAP